MVNISHRTVREELNSLLVHHTTDITTLTSLVKKRSYVNGIHEDRPVRGGNAKLAIIR